MTTRPFKLVNRTELQHLSDVLRRHARAWASEWLCGEVCDPRLTLTADMTTEELRAADWRVRRGSDGVGVAVGSFAGSESLRHRLTGMGDRRSSGIDDTLLRALEDAAIHALLGLIFGPAAGKDGKLPESSEYQVAGSGYVLAHCRFDDSLELRILLWPQTVRAWLNDPELGTTGRRPPAVSRLEALDTQKVTIEVIVGEAEIVFEEFRALCAGFVVKLDRRLDQPLQVRVIGDGVLCAGHLGLNDDRRAVQVVATN